MKRHFLLTVLVSLITSFSYAQSGCYVTANADQLYNGIHPVSGGSYDCNYYILNCNGASPTSRYAVLGTDLGACSFTCGTTTFSGRLRNYTVYQCPIDTWVYLFFIVVGSIGFYVVRSTSLNLSGFKGEQV